MSGARRAGPPSGIGQDGPEPAPQVRIWQAQEKLTVEIDSKVESIRKELTSEVRLLVLLLPQELTTTAPAEKAGHRQSAQR